MLRKHPGHWVATAQSEEEARLAGARPRGRRSTLDGDTYRVRYVAPDRETYDRYYNIVANPMLWFIQHYLWDLGPAPRHPRRTRCDAWRDGLPAGQPLFAEAIARRDRRRRRRAASVVRRCHDYHLYLAAPRVRARRARAPSCSSSCTSPGRSRDYWRVLPARDARGGLPRPAGQRHRRLPHAATTSTTSCAAAPTCSTSRSTSAGAPCCYGDREVWVRAYPVSIDPATLRRGRRSAGACASEERQLRARRRELPAACASTASTSRKNIIRGLRRLRPLPRAAPRVQGPHHLPRPAAAVARGRRGVRRVPASA